MTEVLYRKYRPKNFKEMLGQDHIVEILTSAIKAKKTGHAYLFSGPRGTGKTSAARILASEIGCHNYDLWEMDAASSRGIDEIRALREGVSTVPLRGAVKVYIIDEVHMLTKEAFNALLKTLEEPPKHAVFILATTEPQKLPETIISRCQHLAFKKVPEDILRKSILDIAKKEGIELDEEGAGLIALFADGSFRDSQTMLDQVLSLGGGKITSEQVRKFLSAPSKKFVEEFISALIEKDVKRELDIVQEVIGKGESVQLFLKFVLRGVRFVLLFKFSPAKVADFENIIGKEEFLFLQSLKEKISVADLGFILVTLLAAYDSAGRAYLPQLLLELALAKIHLRNEGKK
ncbi:MAG: DNA polymerase III subunit gamma/tau [bacterium]|nr:DNA polymerase III subunit gamma/tau [bacterium]